MTERDRAKYDGWETRRHNPAEYDWVVIKLGCVATFNGVEVDTSYFTGNYGELASLDACYEPTGSQDSAIASSTWGKWETVLEPQPCGPSQRQAWKLSPSSPVAGKPFTHVRLRMYPDGGFARLRLYGKVVPPPVSTADTIEELSSALNGGVATACSDQHYGVISNLILPGRGVDMGDGWETARSRGKGHVDWVIVRLGLQGKSIDKIVIDTKDFKGNFPREVRVEGLVGEGKSGEEPGVDNKGWKPLLQGGDQPGKRDVETVFEGEKGLDIPALSEGEVWTHVKMTMVPDGGVKRLRIFGCRA